jgi:hypothetical protein
MLPELFAEVAAVLILDCTSVLIAPFTWSSKKDPISISAAKTTINVTKNSPIKERVNKIPLAWALLVDFIRCSKSVLKMLFLYLFS